MALSLTFLLVVGLIILLAALRMKAFDTDCTGDCNQGRNCNCKYK